MRKGRRDPSSRRPFGLLGGQRVGPSYRRSSTCLVRERCAFITRARTIARIPTISRIHPSATSSTKLRSNCTTFSTRISPMTTRTMPSPIPMFSPCGCRGRQATSRARSCPSAEEYPAAAGVNPADGSERGLVEVHQGQIRGLRDGPLGGDLRHHVACEELSRGHLALVERAILRSDLAAELPECDLRLAQQQP